MSPSSTKADIQSRTETLLLCKTHFHCYRYLLRENLPILPSPLSSHEVISSPSPSSPSSHLDTSPAEDLDVALDSLKSLLSLPPESPSNGQSPTSRASTSTERVYTLSTHLIGTLYFLSLKATNPQTLSTALDLFSHPRIRNTRDGLWDAHTASFVIQNLLKLRTNGTHTAAKRVHMEFSDRADVKDMVTFQDMSTGNKVPMMQSRTVTVALAPAPTSRSNETQDTTNNALLLLPPYFPINTTTTTATPTPTMNYATTFNSASSHQSTTPPTSSSSIVSSTAISPSECNNTDSLELETIHQTWPPVLNCPSPRPILRPTLQQSAAFPSSPFTSSPVSSTIPPRRARIQSPSKNVAARYPYDPRPTFSHTTRLEDIGLGVVDADGGVNEAARKVWSRIQELDLSLTI